MEKSNYRPLMGEESYDDDSALGQVRIRPSWTERYTKNAGAYVTIVNLILFMASLSSLIVSAKLYYKSEGRCNILDETSFFSPVASTLQPVWKTTQAVTTLITSPESIYRQDPSPKVDAAWERITDIGVLTISEADVRKLGKDPSKTVKAPTEWGYGTDAHLAELDAFHHMHCLNSLRQSLHFNFEYYHPYGISETFKAHLSHCLDALREHLMCQPSVELITHNWVEKQEHPFPDFDINRKCWDFEQLIMWQDERRVPIEGLAHKWQGLDMPKGNTRLPVPLLMLEAYNMTMEEYNTLHA